MQESNVVDPSDSILIHRQDDEPRDDPTKCTKNF